MPNRPYASYLLRGIHSRKSLPSATGAAYQTRKDEQKEQIWFVDWCRTQTYTITDSAGDKYLLRLDAALVAYPGGAFLSGDKKRRAMQWSILRKMGCRKGVSDLVLNLPANGYHGMHIEMKKRRDQFKSSTAASMAVSLDQTAYLQLMGRLGYATAVAFGWTEAARKVCQYLQWHPPDHGL